MRDDHFDYDYKVRVGTVLFLLALLILLIYSNTFHASWQFDDKPNILNNTRLHLEDLSPGSLWQTFFAKAGREAFYRPLPNLSLALNWYVGKDDTFGYHLANIAIHVLTALFLYLASRLLLQTPKAKPHCNSDDIGFIALLSAVLWAVNPIQIQAVTYIVQRMASMAAMFYILGIFCYLKGRLSKKNNVKTLYFMGCFLCFVFALLSKENAVMLPVSLILVELVFFQNRGSLQKIKNYKSLLFVFGTICIIIGAVYVKNIGYGDRPFTMVERLLTETRILLFYLSQIFYPLPERLSIAHDVIVSKSLLSPWTTLPAILAIFVLIGLAVGQMWKRPLPAFAVLFFFLNHLIESTIIPLELIFEHRNYLPSFFLFLPLAAGMNSLLNRHRNNNRPIFISLVAFSIAIIIGLGCFTYIRNYVWQTEITLWRDAMQKAPNDARPVSNLAIQLAWGEDAAPLRYDVALAMFNKALRLNKARNFLNQEVIANMGLIYFNKGEYDKAVECYDKALQMNPLFLKARYDLANALIMLGQWEAATRHVDLLINNPKRYLKPNYFNLKGFILLWQQKPENALVYFQKALKMKSGKRAAILLNTGVALSLTGRHGNAEFVLNEAARISTDDIRPVYALIENSFRSGNAAKAEQYAEWMFAKFSVQAILDGIDFFSENYQTAPMAPELIVPAVMKKITRLSEKIETLSHAAWVE